MTAIAAHLEAMTHTDPNGAARLADLEGRMHERAAAWLGDKQRAEIAALFRAAASDLFYRRPDKARQLLRDLAQRGY